MFGCWLPGFLLCLFVFVRSGRRKWGGLGALTNAHSLLLCVYFLCWLPLFPAIVRTSNRKHIFKRSEIMETFWHVVMGFGVPILGASERHSDSSRWEGEDDQVRASENNPERRRKKWSSCASLAELKTRLLLMLTHVTWTHHNFIIWSRVCCYFTSITG